MNENVKRLFYARSLMHPVYADIIATRPEIRFDKIEATATEAEAAPVMAAGHAYQVSSARDELPKQYHVNADFLSRTPKLLVVSTGGAGFDTVNVRDCSERGVLVVNQTGGNAASVAQHVLAMVIALSKQIVQTNHALRAGTLKDRNLFMGHEVQGRTIGIVGLGNVGRRVAELCRTLFGMQVLAVDPYLDEKEIAARGAVKVELDELLRRSDFVSINCPLDDSSRGMMGAKQFAMMQPHAYFITTARGSIHDEKALEEALREKRIAGAALDVFEQEPLPADSELWDLPEVRLTPHVSGPVIPADVVGFFLDNLERYLAGERLERRIDRELGY
jgi:D-3-phosphoglycerate dehydrogenase